MTTRLTFICHSATEAVRASAFPADEPLDSQARRKLARLAPVARFADRYLSSPALRARQTAEAVRLDFATEPQLRDIDYGDWSGRSLEDLQAEAPDAVAAWLADPAAAPHGGESVAELIERVGAWLDGLREAPGKVVAVTHAGVIRAAVVHVLEASPRAFWRLDVAPLSLTRLSAAHDRWTLAALN